MSAFWTDRSQISRPRSEYCPPRWRCEKADHFYFRGQRTHARILIVEDHAIIAEDLAEMVADWGYLVVGIAQTCDEALLMLENQRPDLVLMDIDFRGHKSGIFATLRIQKELRVPVVYVTGCASEELGPALAMTDPRGFVPKPIDSDRLAAVIRRALRGPGRLSSS